MIRPITEYELRIRDDQTEFGLGMIRRITDYGLRIRDDQTDYGLRVTD